MHSDGIVDELSAKHSHLSSQSQFESESGDGDFDSIFSSQIFSMVLKWVAQASTFTVQPGVRSSRTRLAQRLALPLAPHFAQDIVTDILPLQKTIFFMRSDWFGNLNYNNKTAVNIYAIPCWW